MHDHAQKAGLQTLSGTIQLANSFWVGLCRTTVYGNWWYFNVIGAYLFQFFARGHE
jgi:hypothetical protein